MKKKHLMLALLGIGAFAFAAPAPAFAAVPESKVLSFSPSRPALQAITDIVYSQHITRHGNDALKMDVLIDRSSQEKRPAIVFVTGGGFLGAPKEKWIQQRVHIAEAGYVVASIQYHVVPSGTYKDAVRDVKAAIRYLRAHADDFGIDKDRIAVMGESAGGYLSAMVGTSNGVKDFDCGDNLSESSDVQAAIDIFGLSDLTKVGDDFSKKVQESHRSAGASEALFVNGIPPFGKGGSIESNPESAKAANPMTYISKKTAPFLLMHGDKDQLVSPSQTAILFEALQKKGIPSERYIVTGADHADRYWYQPEVEKVILDFLDQNLKNKK